MRYCSTRCPAREVPVLKKDRHHPCNCMTPAGVSSEIENDPPSISAAAAFVEVAWGGAAAAAS
eukprot:2477575-Pyramimonas_sp.AAC.1